MSNGNYVVGSPSWNEWRGAVTWANGSRGVSGTVSEANSLVGSNPGDYVGITSLGFDLILDVTPLSNGNYVVGSPFWNGNRGAVTWGNGSTGVSGIVSDANSLVGSNPNDRVGNGGNLFDSITHLSNGNYVVASPNWSDGRGAVTWANGSTGVRGSVSDANSFVGSYPGD